MNEATHLTHLFADTIRHDRSTPYECQTLPQQPLAQVCEWSFSFPEPPPGYAVASTPSRMCRQPRVWSTTRDQHEAKNRDHAIAATTTNCAAEVHEANELRIRMRRPGERYEAVVFDSEGIKVETTRRDHRCSIKHRHLHRVLQPQGSMSTTTVFTVSIRSSSYC